MRNTRLALGFFLLALPVWAQVNVGHDVTLGLTGDLGFGYNGDYGNLQNSEHSYGINGDAQLNGYYYNPNFLKFNVTSFLDRDQANSGSASLTDASAVGGSISLFGGSHFPGGISFGKTFDSSNTYGVPGSQGLLTHGNATQFGIGWAETIPGLPPLNAQYSQGSSESSTFGTSDQTHSTSRVFTLGSTYRMKGWWTTGRFTEVSTSTQLPEYLSNGGFNTSDANTKSLNFNTTHKLPLQGQTSIGYSYSSSTGSGNGQTVTGSNQEFSATASFIPVRRVSTAFGVEYNSSLAGMIEQVLNNAGSVAPQVNLGGQSHSLTMYNFDSLNIYKNLDASFSFNHTQEVVYGQSVTLNHFSAIVNYHFQKPLWGSVEVYGGVNDAADNNGNDGTGLIAGVNFGRTMLGFDWTGSFGYSQNVETVIESVQSSYTYLASARRHFGRHLTWNNSFSGYHTGLGEAEGSSAHSESYSSTALYRRYSLGGSYAKSYGAALVTANGLVTAPTYVVPVLNSNQYLLVNGSSMGITASASPVDRLSLNANFSKALSSMTGPTLDSTGSSKAFTFYTQYQMRKISLGAGYTKVMQGIGTGTLGSTPQNYTTYYIGIQRWFNPF